MPALQMEEQRPGEAEWLVSHLQSIRQVSCSEFTDISPPTTPLGPKTAHRRCSEKNALVFF